MKIIKEEDFNVPVKNWCDNIEDGALEQAKNLANLPFVFRLLPSKTTVLELIEWSHKQTINPVN